MRSRKCPPLIEELKPFEEDMLRNLFEMDAQQYEKLLRENVTKHYRHAPEEAYSSVNREAHRIATEPVFLTARSTPSCMHESPFYSVLAATGGRRVRMGCLTSLWAVTMVQRFMSLSDLMHWQVCLQSTREGRRIVQRRRTCGAPRFFRL